MPKPTINDKIISLGALLLQFAKTDRKTYHEDGITPESDTDHTVMLGVIACAYAQKFAPELDLGKIAQFALIHDLVEVYAKDTPTLRILTHEDRKDKEEREQQALEQIELEFGDTFPWIIETIKSYETLNIPEARFIKVLDKIMPKITAILNNGAAAKEQGITKEMLLEIHNHQLKQIMSYASEWPGVINLWQDLVNQSYTSYDQS